MTSNPSTIDGDSELEDMLHKFAGCGYPHPHYVWCEWCSKIPELITVLKAREAKYALSARINELGQLLGVYIPLDPHLKSRIADLETELGGEQQS